MKRIRQTSLVGQQGVNLIEKIVLEMGFLWLPIRRDWPAPSETGEIR
jgi:hypothetical protein